MFCLKNLPFFCNTAEHILLAIAAIKNIPIDRFYFLGLKAYWEVFVYL